MQVRSWLTPSNLSGLTGSELRFRVLQPTTDHMILPCHHFNLCSFRILFCLLAHIIKLFPILQHCHNLLSPYTQSPKPTNVLSPRFVCWHLAQHMLPRSSSHVSKLLFQTPHTYSYHQLRTTGFENFHRNS